MAHYAAITRISSAIYFCHSRIKNARRASRDDDDSNFDVTMRMDSSAWNNVTLMIPTADLLRGSS